MRRDKGAPRRQGAVAAIFRRAPDWRVQSAVAEPVIVLAHDSRPLVVALAARSGAFCHGDVTGVNMTWDANDLVLLDWGRPRSPPSFRCRPVPPVGLTKIGDQQRRVAADLPDYDRCEIRPGRTRTLTARGLRLVQLAEVA